MEGETELEEERKREKDLSRTEAWVQQQVALCYLLGLGLVLKEHLEEGSGQRRVGQQGEGGGCSQEACRHREYTSDRKYSALSQ